MRAIHEILDDPVKYLGCNVIILWYRRDGGNPYTQADLHTMIKTDRSGFWIRSEANQNVTWVDGEDEAIIDISIYDEKVIIKMYEGDE